jgi:hypothetical protein
MQQLRLQQQQCSIASIGSNSSSASSSSRSKGHAFFVYILFLEFSTLVLTNLLLREELEITGFLFGCYGWRSISHVG